MVAFERTHVDDALPRPLWSLDARGGVLVAVLQTSPHDGPGVEWGPALVCRWGAPFRREILSSEDGPCLSARVDPTGRRVALVSRRRPSDPATDVVLRDLDDGRPLARRPVPTGTVFDAVPFGDRVAVGRHLRPWTPEHGPKLEIWSLELERAGATLDVNDAGHVVEVAGDVVASAGIDLHVWRPGTRPFALDESAHFRGHEVSHCSLSSDGRFVAFANERRGEKWIASEPAAQIVEWERSAADGTRIHLLGQREVSALALSPDAAFLALVVSGEDDVLVHDGRTGDLVARLETRAPRRLAWLDAQTLAIGGPHLELWRVRS